MGGPPGPEALYQQNNLTHLDWDQDLREIVQGNNSSIDQIFAEKSDASTKRWDKSPVE